MKHSESYSKSELKSQLKSDCCIRVTKYVYLEYLLTQNCAKNIFVSNFPHALPFLFVHSKIRHGRRKFDRTEPKFNRSWVTEWDSLSVSPIGDLSQFFECASYLAFSKWDARYCSHFLAHQNLEMLSCLSFARGP